MKTLKQITLTILMAVFVSNIAQSQTDYKGHKITADGKITDKEGKHIGTVTADGIINDAAGKKVAYVDANGFLIDGTTGKNLGKVGKNGNFIPYTNNAASWTISEPENGICLVKDKDGKVIAEVHETYKHIGACAIHCLTNHMKHGEIVDKSNMAYSCPMHPDVTSDKEGKCGKCGMALVKKK